MAAPHDIVAGQKIIDECIATNDLRPRYVGEFTLAEWTLLNISAAQRAHSRIDSHRKWNLYMCSESGIGSAGGDVYLARLDVMPKFPPEQNHDYPTFAFRYGLW